MMQTKPFPSAWKLLAALWMAAPALATTYTFVPSTALLENPERGLYRAAALESGTDFADVRTQGSTLCYANITLDAFRSSNISATRLQEIDDAFARMRGAGLKCVLRINYNEDSSGTDTTLAWMETHLQQLQPILEGNSELIAFVQAGMIGAWGEWHSSSNGLDTPENRAAVYDLLVAYLPAGKFIQIRTPGFVDELVGLDTNPINDSTAFSGTPRARIAYHNDAWISSPTDMGTYPSDPVAMETLKSEIENHTKYAPWGGESAALDTNYTASTYVLAEAARFHATYLNATYHPDVIAQLTANGSWGEIQKKLGYRIELVSATLPDSLAAGSTFPFEVRLQNSGWAPFYNPRPVFLRVLSGSIVIQQIKLQTDPRFWRPDSGEIVLSGTAHAASTIAPENLGFALWLPDSSDGLQSLSTYSVRLANDNVWDASSGHNLLKPAAEEPPGAIVVDGSLDDWNIPSSTFYTDAQITDGSPANSSYEAVYLTNDAANLYIGLDTKGSGGGDIGNTWFHNIYLDTDMDATSGFNSGWMAHGYDRLLQYGGSGGAYSLYEFGGTAQSSWAWNFLGLVKYAYSNDVAEISVSLPSLGLSGSSFVVELNVTGTGVSTETWASQYESDAKTFTLSTSPPPTNQLFTYEPATGNILMRWNGEPNAIVAFDFSADLQRWDFLGNGILDSGGDLLYIDHPPASEPHRFYRAK